mmetsp:Transcript_11570/g.30725  ORF Transcript_11570/g.30725 Transcript_11570/m.30725 type:complete len:301 (-) Transcript_11570:1607-2509(-)
MARPSSTAATIVAKLSSASTMSAACLETSVPAIPIAMPMAACWRAGASLTPSPVIAATSPKPCSCLMSRCLSCGSARQKTRLRVSSSCSCCSSGSEKKDDPSKTSCAPPSPSSSSAAADSSRMLTSRAMALAVAAESPVIMMTRMPASRQRRIDVATSGRAGSLMPTMPRKTRPCSTSTKRCGSESSPPAGPRSSADCTLASAPSRRSLTARARQRSGRSAIPSKRSRSCARSSSVMRTVRPSVRRRAEQRGSTDSGAPLTKRELRPLSLFRQRTAMLLRERENSSVARRSYSAARRSEK